MDITNAKRAEVLVHALPYIQEYTGKIVVIKYGGNAMINEDLKDSVMMDIVLLSLIGVRVVLVHGGGPEITDMLKKIGKESVFVDGLRVTDRETADTVQMVLAGKVNKSLVARIENKGGNAIGLSGMDGRMIEARVKDARLGFVGEITKVNVAPILDVIDKGYIPVVSTVGCDREGNVYNINVIRTADAPGLIADGTISGGMIPKVECCINAIHWGVNRVFIIDGRIPHAILIEMLTNEGIGTMFTEGLPTLRSEGEL